MSATNHSSAETARAAPFWPGCEQDDVKPGPARSRSRCLDHPSLRAPLWRGRQITRLSSPNDTECPGYTKTRRPRNSSSTILLAGQMKTSLCMQSPGATPNWQNNLLSIIFSLSGGQAHHLQTQVEYLAAVYAVHLRKQRHRQLKGGNYTKYRYHRAIHRFLA